jgi:hypothetical protein
LVLIYFTFPIACLVYGWRVWVQRRNEPTASAWKSKLLTVGLCMASLISLSICGFILRGYNSHGQSFAQPPPLPWLRLNQLSTIAWLFVLLSVAIGKGKPRLPLFLWWFSFPLTALFIMFMGFIY